MIGYEIITIMDQRAVTLLPASLELAHECSCTVNFKHGSNAQIMNTAFLRCCVGM